MKKRQVLINAIMSITRIIVIGIVFFILYRFLLNTIGIEQLGIWSLVLAFTSVTQIANFGLGGSVVKFVAKYVAREEAKKVSEIIQTAALSVGAFVGLILVACYPIAKFVLRLVISSESLPLALAILPYTFLALWIMVLTSIFHAGLDGYQRIDLRSNLLMGGAILHLFLCFLLAPSYGLVGVAYARVIQNITILFSSFFVLKRCLPIIPIFRFKWNKRLFKEIIGYGINYQVISITSMFYDPLIKAFLGKFGGLSMVGYFEMASKMIQQLRLLIVSANQVLFPAIANLKEKTPDKIQSVYLTSYQLVFYLALPLFSLIIVCTPIISVLWIGRYESTFVTFGILLAIGWFLNILSSPAYYANLGIGELRWNVRSYVTVTLLSAILGFLFGVFYDGIGVVVASIVSLTIGGSIIYVSYHLRHKIPLKELLPTTSKFIIIACLVSIISTLIIQNKLNHSLNYLEINGILALSFLIILFIPFWLHPMRRRLSGWLTGIVLDKQRNNNL